jgi:cyclopropane fatty-acyl-phospholipid synthase-like methyltransferase
VCVFTKKTNNQTNLSLSEEMYSTIEKDIKKLITKKLFPAEIPGGTNALSQKTIKKLIAKAGFQRGDITWEIGMGLPYLALTIACVTKAEVVATDISKYIMQYIIINR